MIKKIFKTLGTPNEEIWPGFSELPVMKQMTFPTHEGDGDLRDKYNISRELLDDQGYNLMMRMLHYNPE